MYVRLVTDLRDECSHQKLGVIRAAWRFQDQIRREDWARLEMQFDWFNRNLRMPDRLARPKRRHAQKKALCWFKEGVGRPLTKMSEIAAILEGYDVATRMLTTTRPGYIVYEDNAQIAAIPFRDTVMEVTESNAEPCRL